MTKRQAWWHRHDGLGTGTETIARAQWPGKEQLHWRNGAGTVAQSQARAQCRGTMAQAQFYGHDGTETMALARWHGHGKRRDVYSRQILALLAALPTNRLVG